MSYEQPTPDELKNLCARLARSEKKFRLWRAEYRRYAALYANDPKTANEMSAGGNAPGGGRNDVNTVHRNAVFVNVNRDIRRLTVKEAMWDVAPMVSRILTKTPDGQEVPVDGLTSAQAQGEAAGYIFKEIGFCEEVLPLCLEQNGTGNEGWAKVVTRATADANETPVWVSPEEVLAGSDTDNQAKAVKPRGVVNSRAGGRLGVGVIWADVDDVICDADAVTKSEFTYICHRIKKPLDNMKYEMIEDYDVVLDDEGRIAYQPVMEQELVRVPSMHFQP